jgi:hypothetical protein
MRLVANLLAGLLVLTGCAGVPSPEERRGNADALAMRQGWMRISIPAGPFDLTAYLPQRFAGGDSLAVYIEGDGFAWASRSQPSADPTPQNPLGLLLALNHPAANAAYLARPCQYIDDAGGEGCPRRYWTGQRFAAEVIESSDRALDALKARFGAQRLMLVGYSGGGAVAALLAAGRGDVECLVTVAGNLDHRAWTSLHRVQPLRGSLNPVDYRHALSGIPQFHFVGGRDKVVPPAIAEGYVSGFDAERRPEIQVVSDYGHECCWVEEWSKLVGDRKSPIFGSSHPSHKSAEAP